jgi:hypothetical protein
VEYRPGKLTSSADDVIWSHGKAFSASAVLANCLFVSELQVGSR